MEALDEKSLTPLLTAVSWGKSEAVKCLLDLGAQIDATDKDEKNGVFLATRLNAIDILKVCIVIGGSKGRAWEAKTHPVFTVTP